VPGRSKRLIAIFTTPEVLITGEFNLAWGKQDAHYLIFFCTNLNLTQLITNPTSPNLKGPMELPFIDLIFTNSGVFVSHLLKLPLSGARSRQLSNHYAHLSLSLHAPAPHDIHLDSITFLITTPLSVIPRGSFLRLY
jgi:hypothetical protein